MPAVDYLLRGEVLDTPGGASSEIPQQQHISD
jgi:hypothetical protein